MYKHCGKYYPVTKIIQRWTKMARPTTKVDLLEAATKQCQRLMTVLNDLTEEEINGTFDWSNQKIGKEAHWDRDKNIKDVLIHLYEWHQLLIRWIDSNVSGETTSFLPSPSN